MLPAALNWITAHGYGALYLLLMLGIVGLPIPDETLLTFAGYLVDKGDLRLSLTLATAVLGSSSGITLSFGIGHLLGSRRLKRVSTWIHLTPARLDRARAWFARTGKWSLVIGYFIPGLRHVIAIVAGASGVRIWEFALYAYSGALLWCCTFVSLGVFLGKEWMSWSERIHKILLVVAGLVAIGVAIYWLRQRRRRS
jgi:membrane protein DedA with SNARE-associated domain